MKISYNWLSQYLKVNHSIEQLSEVLTNTGLEVEGIENFTSIEGGLVGLVIGEVLEKEKHPDADRLAITKVNVGNGSELQIVCGAPNVAKGQKVVVATVGTTLYPSEGGSFKIKKSKIRGAVSEGMICAEDEIGLGTGHDGIMVLPSNVEVGTHAADYFEVENDYIFEIGLTPNRSDAMSHIGVARDVAAALNAIEDAAVIVKEPELEPIVKEEELPIAVEVLDEKACPRYSGVILSNIKVAPSPMWMQNRLKAVGVRPINNIVDITNFVLKEYGQPLHAFDYKAIKGAKVVVRKANPNEEFVTLDAEKRKLSESDLMICNEADAMCMAGVFGGIDSGVTDNTSEIFLESAYFDSSVIRVTSTSHGLRTDAAQRYEKGADPNITIPALNRAIDLLVELAGAKVASDVVDVYPTNIDHFNVKLSLSRLEQLGGVKIEDQKVIDILEDLDIECKEIIEASNGVVLDLLVPPYRADVQREADVIEEVLRIYGFNNIPMPSFVKSTLTFTDGVDVHSLKERVAQNLNGLGFSEITTNSISKSAYYKEQEPQGLVKLQNSMTAELDVMRKSLIPEGLEVIAHNINRKNTNLSLYEFGNIYNSDYTQNEKLVLFQTGLANDKNWLSKGNKSSYYSMKGSITALLEALGITENVVSNDLSHSWLDYGTTLTKNDKELAHIGMISPEVLNGFEISQEVFYAELDWKYILKLLKKKKIKFQEIAKYPKVDRDLAVVVDEEVTFESVSAVINKSGGKMLQDVQLFDVFRNEEKIGAGKKSYAIRFSLLNREKTLTDKEIDKIFSKIMRTLEEQLNATIRK